MSRKSARSRKPNPKFQDGTITNLADVFGSDSEPDPYYLPKVRDTEKDDDDFDDREAAIDEVAPTNDADGDLSLSEADAAGASDASDGASAVENSDIDDVLSNSDDDPIGAAQRDERRARTRHVYQSGLQPDTLHSRGFPDAFKLSTGKEGHWKFTFGTAKEDTRGIITSRDRWTDVGSVTFPSKAGLRQVVQEKTQDGGDKCVGWYNREEGMRFRKNQRVEKLGSAEGKTYLPRANPGKEDGHSFLMGPLSSQRVFHLPLGQSMNIADAWPRAPGFPPVREGWLWNVGRGAQAIAWAPLPPQSARQYLALCVPSSKEQKVDYMTKNTEWENRSGAPAFVPAPPVKACIQIWEFKSKYGKVVDDKTLKTRVEGEQDVLNVPDMKVKPQLRLVIATEWGDVRRLQWCPAYSAQTSSAAVGGEEADSSLGLLAGLWGDGRARVIDVRLGDYEGDEPEYIRLLQAPFEIIPLDSIFTALAWFSPAELGLGTAHGAVSIFNIPICTTLPAPKPFFHQQIHSSYILVIAPAVPHFPHLLASSSMDGFTHLTDLRDPGSDKVSPKRSRLATAHIQYLAPIRCMIQSEENEIIKILPLRRFFSGNAAAKASASVTSLATSPLHPCTLAGAADGTVIGTNPTRRAVSHKTSQYQQCWFAHDYSPRGGEAGEGKSMSRILDGFKAEKSNTSKTNPHVANGEAWATTWEEGGHITALAWNLNTECGGWAAASMGSGLMRVEDLSI